jgi:CO dehydrogenase/acetyl-CoA synthase beta subunit
MEFSDAVSNPSVLDKTEEEEEREEEEDEDEKNDVEQECTTSEPEDTAVSGRSKQADKPNGTEYKGTKMCCTNVLLSVTCIKLRRYFYKFTKGIK